MKKILLFLLLLLSITIISCSKADGEETEDNETNTLPPMDAQTLKTANLVLGNRYINIDAIGSVTPLPSKDTLMFISTTTTYDAYDILCHGISCKIYYNLANKDPESNNPTYNDAVLIINRDKIYSHDRFQKQFELTVINRDTLVGNYKAYGTWIRINK